MSLWRWAVIAAGITALMLLVTLPAAWVWQQGSGAGPLPPGLTVSAVRGSVWAGRAQIGLGAPQAALTRIELEFDADAACWLRLQPGYRLRLRAEDAEVRLRVCRALLSADAGWVVTGAGQLPAAWLFALHAASGAAPPPLRVQGRVVLERLKARWAGEALALLELSARMEQPRLGLVSQSEVPPLALGPLQLRASEPGSRAPESLDVGKGREREVVAPGGVGPAGAEAIWLRLQEGVSADDRPVASVLGLDLTLAQTESGLQLSLRLKPSENLPEAYRAGLRLLGPADAQGGYHIRQRLRQPEWLPPSP